MGLKHEKTQLDSHVFKAGFFLYQLFIMVEFEQFEVCPCDVIMTSHGQSLVGKIAPGGAFHLA